MSERKMSDRKIYAYGEDSLTLWALKNRLRDICEQLSNKIKNKLDHTSCTVIYRPSFGRGALIGEFDAILIFGKKVFLVEAKWDKSNEFKKRATKIIVTKTQIKRHNNFKDNYKEYIDSATDSTRKKTQTSEAFKSLRKLIGKRKPQFYNVLLFFFDNTKYLAKNDMLCRTKNNKLVQLKIEPIELNFYPVTIGYATEEETCFINFLHENQNPSRR